MLKKTFISLLLVVTCMTYVHAAELRVADGTITTGIENQLPVDRVDTYPADYGKLYCFTRIVGAAADTEVTHVWFFQDDEMARVTLPIRSGDWRTYSSKRFFAAVGRGLARRGVGCRAERDSGFAVSAGIAIKKATS